MNNSNLFFNRTLKAEVLRFRFLLQYQDLTIPQTLKIQIMFSFLDDLFKSNPKPIRTRYPIFTYITVNGGGRFVFSYHRVSRGFEIDIHSQPSYNGRKDDPNTIHRIGSSRDTKYQICVDYRHTPETLQAAKDISMAWAEYTMEYVNTGITIDAQIKIEQAQRNN